MYCEKIKVKMVMGLNNGLSSEREKSDFIMHAIIYRTTHTDIKSRIIQDTTATDSTRSIDSNMDIPFTTNT